MTRKFTRRFDPNGARDPEYELSDYDHRTRSPVGDPYIFDFEPSWTVDPHTTDLNVQLTDSSNGPFAPLPQAVFFVPGGVPHEVLHISAGCPALSADLALAKRAIPSAATTSSSSTSTHPDGLACVVCLPNAAPLTLDRRPASCQSAAASCPLGCCIGAAIRLGTGGVSSFTRQTARVTSSLRANCDQVDPLNMRGTCARMHRPLGDPDTPVRGTQTTLQAREDILSKARGRETPTRCATSEHSSPIAPNHRN